MTTTTASRALPAGVLLAAGIVVAILANTVVSLAAVAAGASATYPPLTIWVYGAFTVAGVLVGYLGWRLNRHAPARLRVLVPTVLVLSFIPDIAALVIGFIPGTTTTGVVALTIMHLTTAAVALPVYSRLAPAGSSARRA